MHKRPPWGLPMQRPIAGTVGFLATPGFHDPLTSPSHLLVLKNLMLVALVLMALLKYSLDLTEWELSNVVHNRCLGLPGGVRKGSWQTKGLQAAVCAVYCVRRSPPTLLNRSYELGVTLVQGGHAMRCPRGQRGAGHWRSRHRPTQVDHRLRCAAGPARFARPARLASS